MGIYDKITFYVFDTNRKKKNFQSFVSSISMALLIVCGRSSLYVSGSFITKAAERRSGAPTINMGNGCQYFARGPRNGAQAQKTLETAEQKPTAWVLKLVGYNSAVIK